MKSSKSALLALLLLVSSIVFGQDYAFKVMASKGNNEMKSGGTWQPVKIGASLKASDEIKLADNSYIGLIHKSGKPLEIREAKPFKVSDLEAQVKGGSSALNKYTDFILSNNEKKSSLSATGAVHRATETNAISVMLPESQYSGVYNNQVIIRWDNSDLTGPFVVTMSNLFGDVLDKVETSEKNIWLDLSQPKFAEWPVINVSVNAKADPKKSSKQYTVKRLSTSDSEKIAKQLKEIMGELSEPTALNHILLAGFYESQGLLIDAMASYEQAVKIEPYYQEDYNGFLLRHGLKR
jgi:hypothetical protein